MKNILVTAYLLLLSVITFAQKTDTLVINAGQSKLLTNRYFYELDDPNGILTINQVLNSDKFHPIKLRIPILKYNKSTTWLKFNLKNKSKQPIMIISSGQTIVDEFDLYYVDSASAGLRHVVPDYEQNDVITQNATFVNCPILPGSANTLYLRVKSNAGTVIPVQVYSALAFLQSRRVESITLGVIVGVFVVMSLYNLLLFFIVGDRSYLYYIGYIIFLGLSQILKRGIGSHLFTNNTIILNNYIIPIVRLLLVYFVLLFISEFLQLKQTLKHRYKYYRFQYVIYAILLIAVLCGTVGMVYNLLTICISITTFILLVIVIYVYFSGYKPVKFFMLGWVIFLTGVLISVARNKGFVPYNNFTADIVIYCSVLELILFSAALAEKINFYRQQKNQSQNLALAIAKENERLITEQNILLENKVKERTTELINTNRNLSISLDHLTNTQKQLIDHEKMASLGRLTAGVAHEINNPINFVSSNISPLRLDFNELLHLLSKYDEALNNPAQPAALKALHDYKQEIDLDFIKNEITVLLSGIEEGASRTTEIVSSLRTFSSTDELVLKTEDINKSILGNLLILRNTIPDYIEIKPVFDKLEPINCYPGKINQLIINLVNNSIYAIKAKEQHNDESIIITTKDHPEHITIEITDTGIGMSEEIKQKIFEPFFTTKSVGEGTGLGLSIVFGIIEKHQGSIEVISSPGKGATFMISIPKNLADTYKTV